VFGLGFAIEGFSFFLEAIFIGIYVIAVNAWMNHPSGFRVEGGRVVDVNPVTALFGNGFLAHEFVHMYLAAFMVVGFVLAGCYAVGRLRGEGRETRQRATGG
jgi:cytochrome d ubiquinol oxidase subunit I